MSVNLDNVDPEVIAKYALDKLPLNRASTPTADLLNLRRTRAIVTGGGGEGLGNAHLPPPGRAGCQGRRHRRVRRRRRDRPRAIWPNDGASTRSAIAADVGNPDQVSGARCSVRPPHGAGVDLLVNNAGGSGAIKPSGDRVSQHGGFADMENDDLLGVVRVNLIGVMLMTKAVLMPMIAAGHGTYHQRRV